SRDCPIKPTGIAGTTGRRRPVCLLRVLYFPHGGHFAPSQRRVLSSAGRDRDFAGIALRAVVFALGLVGRAVGNLLHAVDHTNESNRRPGRYGRSSPTLAALAWGDRHLS